MNLVFFSGFLLVLWLLTFFQRGRNFLFKWRGWLPWAAIGLAVVSLSLISYWQYEAFLHSDFYKFLLPPYQGWGYFVTYIFTRFWRRWLVGLIMSLIFFFLADYFNKKKDGRLFYEEEPYFLAAMVSLTSYPGSLIFFTLSFILMILQALWFKLMKKDGFISFYKWWGLLALVSYVLGEYLLLGTQLYSKIIF